MRILFVTNTDLGRPELATILHYPMAIAQLGHQVSIFGNTGGDAKRLIDLGIDVFEVRRRSGRWYTTLASVARQVKPDIVHVFIHAGCGSYPFIMRSNTQCKFILDIRSPLLRTGITRALVQAKNRVEIMGYDAIASHGIESAWTVVGKRPSICWFPPGIDLAHIPTRAESTKPAKWGDGELIRAIYVGALQRRRKIAQMIDGLALASRRINLSVDLYGYGESDEISELLEQIRANNLEGQFAYQGLLSRNQLFQKMVEYDVGLSYVPSALFETGPPLKALEYLAAGLPVLATDTIGNRLFVEDSVNGILADESPQAFASGLRRLFSDEERFTRMATNARASVEQYDWLAIARERIIPTYGQLVSRN